MLSGTKMLIILERDTNIKSRKLDKIPEILHLVRKRQTMTNSVATSIQPSKLWSLNAIYY